MRRILLALLLALAMPAALHAAPFVITDSYTAPAVIPDRFRVSFDGGVETVLLPFSGTMTDGTVLTNAVRYDLVGITVGAHTVKIRACKGDPVWGEACSPTPLTPFSFTKPAPPVAPPLEPTGLSLSR